MARSMEIPWFTDVLTLAALAERDEFAVASVSPGIMVALSSIVGESNEASPGPAACRRGHDNCCVGLVQRFGVLPNGRPRPDLQGSEAADRPPCRGSFIAHDARRKGRAAAHDLG